MKKTSLRNQVLTIMNDTEHKQYRDNSNRILKSLVDSEEFKNAHTIGVTISRFPEVDTRPIIEYAWKVGKQVAVPKCIHATREMDFRILTSYNQLETVYMNLMEPVIGETKLISKEKIDLLLVPGVAYSNQGFRIGFGGGYYDRYLVDFEGEIISLAFDCQTDHQVPVENHDIPVKVIITETNRINCNVKGE